MTPELQAASTFLSSFLPSSPNPTFITHLHSLLSARYERHWHPTDPERGSAFRSLVRSGATLDQSIVDAAFAAGISPADLASALGGAQGRVWLGDRWTLWVDPGCVCLRVERTEGGGREGQFIEIYGKLPESLSAHAVSLSSFERSSVNITTTTPVLSPGLLPTSSTSPASLSPPDSHLFSPAKRSSRAIQILRPPLRQSSPAPFSLPLGLPHSPYITPPTPLRSLANPTSDVFSPAPSHLGPALFRRSSSRASSHSSHSGSGSDGEDSLFSSTESLSSSSSGGRTPLWGSKVDGEFKYPPLPARASSFSFPPTSSSTFPFPRSLPTSPTKPRRRGTRGGGSSSITSLTSVLPGHESSSSITSLSSITSATSASRTREQAMQGTLTEHSGGKVGVLGGGVLLGLAGAKAMAGREVGEGKRRGRERRRGGRVGWGIEA